MKPELVADLLALAGDPTDAVPGCPGVGMKSARALIDAFGGIDRIYERLGEVPGLSIRGARSVAEKLERGRASVEKCRDLVVLRNDVPLPGPALRVRGFRPQPPPPTAASFFARLEFTGPLETLRKRYG